MDFGMIKSRDRPGGIRKLCVKLPGEIVRRIGYEKYDSGLTIEEIVAKRLSISFDVCPSIYPAVGDVGRSKRP